MAASAFGLNPIITSVAAGAFNAASEGYVQGTMLDNPPDLFRIAGGVVASAETLPMFGGVAIYENIPTPFGASPTGFADQLGSVVGRATAVSGGSYPYAGFCVFNQAHAMVTSPENPVPTAGSGMSVNFLRKGSGVRLAVACDPALALLEAGPVGAAVSWDFNNQVLQPYDASTATVSVNSAAWAANVYTLNVTTASLLWTPVIGDRVNVSGATNSGTGGNSVVNGNFTVVSVAVSGSNTLIGLGLVAASGVVASVPAGTILLNYGTGALPVIVLGFNVGNSQIVQYNIAANLATWLYTGSTAVILV